MIQIFLLTLCQDFICWPLLLTRALRHLKLISNHARIYAQSFSFLRKKFARSGLHLKSNLLFLRVKSHFFCPMKFHSCLFKIDLLSQKTHAIVHFILHFPLRTQIMILLPRKPLKAILKLPFHQSRKSFPLHQMCPI